MSDLTIRPTSELSINGTQATVDADTVLSDGVDNRASISIRGEINRMGGAARSGGVHCFSVSGRHCGARDAPRDDASRHTAPGAPNVGHRHAGSAATTQTVNAEVLTADEVEEEPYEAI